MVSNLIYKLKRIKLMKLTIKGMPSGKAKGYEIFDEASNLGVTEFDKRIRLIEALSGEMEKAIMSLMLLIMLLWKLLFQKQSFLLQLSHQ